MSYEYEYRRENIQYLLLGGNSHKNKAPDRNFPVRITARIIIASHQPLFVRPYFRTAGVSADENFGDFYRV